jgi:hypothetical protein
LGGKRQFLSLYLFEFIIIIYGLVLEQGSINKCFIQPIVFFVSLELLAGPAATFLFSSIFPRSIDPRNSVRGMTSDHKPFANMFVVQFFITYKLRLRHSRILLAFYNTQNHITFWTCEY